MTMLGLLLMLSYVGNFSIDHVKDLKIEVSIMLTPLGLIRSQFFGEPVWLLTYYHQKIKSFISLDALFVIALLWIRYMFFLKRKSL